ncbi:hypothetical protein UFOVP1288_44 [uncultured Caudovirales phage]|uniref:Holin n=1 Tax=uncultured Caudovirales phage TaxID=2100421 RepID=A0A6J5RIR7_9CAUD|nr:hypothetical protein UFOVP1195_44 [uncultured Caudovirales phage]CAB4195862.1 hypothetical protein UFOVP1288_44 [uncultured Caudovirales phage]CAB4205050.1 hypothetical protein UFOVP1409_44 [uncultured Caudovirales phage]
MVDVKNIFASKAIWGSVVALVSAIAPTVLPLVGIQPGELASITGALGALLAIYGRLTATKRLV